MWRWCEDKAALLRQRSPASGTTRGGEEQWELSTKSSKRLRAGVVRNKSIAVCDATWTVQGIWSCKKCVVRMYDLEL